VAYIESRQVQVDWGSALGREAQVDPMKPELKAPGTILLTLNYDEPLSTFAFNLSLRRYS
jgi:hypothetical protein